MAQRLLARRPNRRSIYPDGFIPSKQLNILAAAWIQTMIHDWLDHELDMEKSVTLDKGFDEGVCLATMLNLVLSPCCTERKHVTTLENI